MGVRFDWDSAKAAANARKHGIGFVEAQTAFGDRLSSTIYDQEHSRAEDRYVTIGWSVLGNLLLVVHTEFEDDDGNEVWWLISARRATRAEARQHGRQAKDR